MEILPPGMTFTPTPVTLRQYYAAKAMATMFATDHVVRANIARLSFEMADAMIEFEQREQKQAQPELPKEIEFRLGDPTKTHRGFEVINFPDYNDEECSLQASSLAIYDKPGTSGVWLGTEDNRMHLDRKRVAALIAHLQAWLETGSFALDVGK